ncbi:MAG: DMT family transporter [Lachnospiraceae bacterium]|nr:DMT family transporter [Lachnospiraceae bacterium]
MRGFQLKINEKGKKLIYVFLLVLTAFIWGTTFVAQSVGADVVGAFTFLAVRNWIAVAALLPVVYFLVIRKKGKGAITMYSFRAGAVCGFFLFTASAAQQIGIADTTTAKAGFITAMYVVLVPLICRAAGIPIPQKIWFCVLLTAAGLYFLCLTENLTYDRGDPLIVLCALLFAFQIISVNHYASRTEPVLIAWFEFFVTAVLSSICMFIFEDTAKEALLAGMPSILFSGLLSSAVAYTLQIVAQKNIHPTVASIIMSLESVFAALAGFVVLHEALTLRELSGCLMIFAAIIISQLPQRKS